MVGVSRRKIDNALPAITGALVQVQLPERFEGLLLGLLREKMPALVLLTNHLPSESTFPLPSLMDAVAPLPEDLQGMRRARSDVSAFEAADVVLLLRVVNWGLSGRDGRDSPLSVSFVIKGTLVNARDRTRGRSFYARYESRKQRFAAWSAEAGKPFRDELWRGIESIAGQIVRQIPPPPPPSSPGALVGAGEF